MLIRWKYGELDQFMRDIPTSVKRVFRCIKGVKTAHYTAIRLLSGGGAQLYECRIDVPGVTVVGGPWEKNDQGALTLDKTLNRGDLKAILRSCGVAENQLGEILCPPSELLRGGKLPRPWVFDEYEEGLRAAISCDDPVQLVICRACGTPGDAWYDVEIPNWDKVLLRILDPIEAAFSHVEVVSGKVEMLGV